MFHYQSSLPFSRIEAEDHIAGCRMLSQIVVGVAYGRTLSQRAVICRKCALFYGGSKISARVSPTPSPMAYFMWTTFPKSVDHRFSTTLKCSTKLLGCAYQNVFGSHQVTRGVLVPGGHDADSSTNWIGQSRSRLASRRSEKPATKAGQIRALWPDIEAALAVGQTMKSICAWLAEDAGIALSVTSLTSYVSRIRRREIQERQNKAIAEFGANVPPEKSMAQESGLPARGPQGSSTNAIPSKQQHHNPLAQAMNALSKPKLDIREIHGDGDPSGKNLI
jgi:hypothetical protein